MHLGGTLEEAGVNVEDVSRVGLADRGAAEEEGHLAVSPDLPLHPIKEMEKNEDKKEEEGMEYMLLTFLCAAAASASRTGRRTEAPHTTPP